MMRIGLTAQWLGGAGNCGDFRGICIPNGHNQVDPDIAPELEMCTARFVRRDMPTPTIDIQTLIWLDWQLLQFQSPAPLRRQR